MVSNVARILGDFNTRKDVLKSRRRKGSKSVSLRVNYMLYQVIGRTVTKQTFIYAGKLKYDIYMHV